MRLVIQKKKAISNPKVALQSVLQKRQNKKPLTPEQKEERKKKVKKIMIAAGAVTLAAAAAYGAYRVSKLNNGLIDHAKRSVWEGRNAFGTDNGISAAEYAKLNTVRGAKRQLGLNNARDLIRYARNNRL